MVELSRSSVHRGLDVRMKVGGMEALDLIGSLILASVMNVFGLPTLLVLGVPALTLLALYFGKRNKPDGFLLHLVRYYITPGHFSAALKSHHGDRIGFKIYEK